jgi:hypothetical protein
MARTKFYFVRMEKRMKGNKVTLVQLQFGKKKLEIKKKKIRNNFLIEFGLWLLREVL